MNRHGPNHSSRRTCRSAGFTLVELLIGLGIVAMLGALLIPAVQQGREAARKTSCASNVRQIIDAFHAHEETFGVFPSARIEQEAWHVRVLPYLEKAKPAYDQSGRRVSGPDEVEVFRCPSDPEVGGNPDSLRGKSFEINAGHGDSRRDGFYCTSRFGPVTPADVTDGLSNTMALAERLVPPEPQWWSSIEYESSYWKPRAIRKTAVFFASFDEFADECELRSNPPHVSQVQHNNYNHIQTPNRLSCTNGNRNHPRSTEYMAVTATSLHPGGVNGCCADGAVHFISDAIDRGVWRSLGTRNGGETGGEAAW